MPIFEFKCEKCATKFEELLRSSSDSNIACPSCGSHEVKRLMSTFACSGERGMKTSVASSGGCGSCSGGSCSTCH